LDRTWEQPWAVQGRQVCFQGTQSLAFVILIAQLIRPCQRLPNQPPIPERTEDGETATQHENEEANDDVAEGQSEPETLPAGETSGTEEAPTHDEEPAKENDG